MSFSLMAPAYGTSGDMQQLKKFQSEIEMNKTIDSGCAILTSDLGEAYSLKSIAKGVMIKMKKKVKICAT